MADSKVVHATLARRFTEEFSVFDQDGNASISAVELRRGVEAFGRALPVETVNEMLRQADPDGKGHIEYGATSSR